MVNKPRKTKRYRLVGATLVATIATGGVLAILRRPPDVWMTRDQQGDRLFRGVEYAQAAATYEDPLRQGVALFRDGQFEGSAAAFARIDNAEASLNRGNALVMLGKYEEAIGSYDRAMQLRPGWTEARENRAVAVARRDLMKPPEDDAGGTGGQLEADEIVFDDRAKNSSQTQQDEVEVGAGGPMSDQELRQLWLQRVQTSPGDFLRNKFAYQLARRQPEPDVPASSPTSDRANASQ